MKKIVLILAMALIAVGVNAQEQGKIRGGMDLGYAMPKGGGGLLYGLEMKYNVKDNWNVGLRWEAALMAKEVNGDNAKISANAGYLATTDYYFNNGSSSFAPFVGGGLGFYGLANISTSDLGDGQEIDLGVGGGTSFGGLLRAGFEAGKFRMTLGYNLIPATKVAAQNLGQNMTTDGFTISNSYLSVSIGFYLGGGKWRK